MSNFIEEFKAGQLGKNMGLPTGLRNLDRAINGLQKKCSIGLAAAQKVGKTALADFCFLVKPYLYLKHMGRLENIHWIYNSYEIDRISKEFKLAALFMFLDCKIFKFEYKNVEYTMSHNYISGRQLHENKDGKVEFVKMTEEHKEMLRGIYHDRIVPLFGEYYKNGMLKTPGKVTFLEKPVTPTAAKNYIKGYFKQHGREVTDKFKTYDDKGKEVIVDRVVDFEENNPDLMTVVITDHFRKMLKDKGKTTKENLDDWLGYSTEFVNGYKATMINLAHSNRGVANIDRLKFAGDSVFPTADDVKDTGNLAEESHILLTMFNPNDEKYNLDRHFGIDLTQNKNPHYRSLHVADARWVESPIHMKLNMFGEINYFEPLKAKPITK